MPSPTPTGLSSPSPSGWPCLLGVALGVIANPVMLEYWGTPGTYGAAVVIGAGSLAAITRASRMKAWGDWDGWDGVAIDNRLKTIDHRSGRYPCRPDDLIAAEQARLEQATAHPGG